VTRYLPFSSGRGIFLGDFLKFVLLFSSDDIDVYSIISLIKRVVERVSDEDVLNTVSAFVASRVISLIIFNKVALDTSLKFTLSL